jgi:coatomer protein complex subunit gamma
LGGDEPTAEAFTWLRALLRVLSTPGESLSKKEASEVFFALTKTFHNRPEQLQALSLLCLKHLAVQVDEAFFLTHTLSRIIAEGGPLKPNALRVMARVSDPSALGQQARVFQQSLTDKNERVSVAASIASLQMAVQSDLGASVVAAWTADAQAALNACLSSSSMASRHLAALLYTCRSSDPAAAQKLVARLAPIGGSTSRSSSSPGVRSNAAQITALRICGAVLRDSPPGRVPASLVETIVNAIPSADSTARTSSASSSFGRAAIVAEAMTQFASLPDYAVTDALVARVAQDSAAFIRGNCPASAQKLAFTRVLMRVCQRWPGFATPLSEFLTTLSASNNPRIATTALITLLYSCAATGADEGGVISSLGARLTTAPPDLRPLLVTALRRVCDALPSLHHALVPGLAAVLRDEAPEAVKASVVATLSAIAEANPAERPRALFQLAEYAEDCEFPAIAYSIVRFLASMVPTLPSADAGHFIRIIYNRCALEGPRERAVATEALGHLAVESEVHRPALTPLLRAIAEDSDDDVRRCALSWLSLLQAAESESPAAAKLKAVLLPEGKIDVAALSASLMEMATVGADLTAVGSAPIAFETTPLEASNPASAASSPICAPIRVAADMPAATETFAPRDMDTGSVPACPLLAVPAVAAAGITEPPVVSSSPQQLSDATDGEISISAIKHFWSDFVLFEVTAENTLSDVAFCDLGLAFSPADLATVGLALVHSDRVAQLAPGHSATLYTLVRREGPLPLGRIGAAATYIAGLIEDGIVVSDPTGFEESYPLDELSLAAKDYILPQESPDGTWASLDAAMAEAAFMSIFESQVEEVADTFFLPQTSPTESVVAIQDHLHVAVVDLPSACAAVASLSAGAVGARVVGLAANFMNRDAIYAVAELTAAPGQGVRLVLRVKAASAGVCNLLLESFD